MIGSALLGVGAGAVMVGVLPRFARAPLDRSVAAGFLAASLAIALGYATMAFVPTDVRRLWDEPVIEGAKLLTVCLALFASFLPIGLLISNLLSRHPDRIARLDFADLLGAGVAVRLSLRGSRGLLAASVAPSVFRVDLTSAWPNVPHEGCRSSGLLGARRSRPRSTSRPGR